MSAVQLIKNIKIIKEVATIRLKFLLRACLS